MCAEELSLKKNTALVLFASEQVWPNLQSIEWLHRQGTLGAIFIYYTKDLQKSNLPAKRIKIFCDRRYQGVKVFLNREGSCMEPQHVFAQLQTWRRNNAVYTDWRVNATGGTKLMFGGALSILEESGWYVFYREHAEGWFIIRRENAGVFSSEKMPDPIADNILNAVPLLDLIETQHTGVADRGGRWECDPLPKLTGPQIEKMLALGPSEEWNWSKLLAGVGGMQILSGFAFEQFLAAVLLAMGLREYQVGLSVRSTDPKTGMPIQEIDIVVNHNGRLIIFDCKLLDDAYEKTDSFVDHVKASRDTSRILGGLGAICVMVRPNRRASRSEQVLADAWRLQLLDLERCRHLFRELGVILQIQPPEVLIEWEEKYLQNYDARAPFFTKRPPLVEDYLSLSEEPQILDVGRLVVKYNGWSGVVDQKWMAVCYPDGFWCLRDKAMINLAIGPGGGEDYIRKSLQNVADKVLAVNKSKSSDWWTAFVFVGTEKKKAFVAWLMRRKNSGLLDYDLSIMKTYPVAGGHRIAFPAENVRKVACTVSAKPITCAATVTRSKCPIVVCKVLKQTLRGTWMVQQVDGGVTTRGQLIVSRPQAVNSLAVNQVVSCEVISSITCNWAYRLVTD